MSQVPEKTEEAPSSLIEARRKKRDEWAGQGLAPYPTAARAKREKSLAAQLHEEFGEKDRETLEALK